MSSKIGQVVRFEVIRQLKKPSFWITLFFFPLLMFGIAGLSMINSSEFKDKELSKGLDKIGVIDEAHLLDNAKDNLVTLNSHAEGMEALKSGQLDVFYQIPADFQEKLSIEAFAVAKNNAIFRQYGAPIKAILKSTAIKSSNPIQVALITGNYAVNEKTIDLASGTEVNLLGKAIIPIIILGIFYIMVCVFGNRLLMAVVEEKENRVSEMILTAVSAKNLILGKIIALVALGFLQIICLLIPVLALVVINRGNPFLSGLLGSIQLDWGAICGNIFLLFISYLFFTGLCTFIGTLVPTARDASQYISPIIFGVMAPFFVINSFFIPEASLTVYIMSYFPLSAPMALMLRNAVGTLPLHELILGLFLLTFYTIIIIWQTVRSFQKHAITFSVVKPHFGPRRIWKR